MLKHRCHFQDFYSHFQTGLILGQNVVPIVRGAANYKKIAPENSYIDANKFKSAESLAQYLLYLDKVSHCFTEQQNFIYNSFADLAQLWFRPYRKYQFSWDKEP